MIQELKKEIDNLPIRYVEIEDASFVSDEYIWKDRVIEILNKYNRQQDYLIIDKKMFNKRLNNQLSEGHEPDCEDYWLAHIETKANKYDNLKKNQEKYAIRISRQRVANRLLISDNRKLNRKLSRSQKENSEIKAKYDLIQEYKFFMDKQIEGATKCQNIKEYKIQFANRIAQILEGVDFE